MRRVFAASLAALFFAPYVFAQGFPGADTALVISVSPAHPAPGDTVTLSVSSPIFDLGGDTVTWRVGNTVVQSGIGETEASLTASRLGETTLVSVEVSGNESAQTATQITPSLVDLLWEADSYTPPFYMDRALPSAGSRIRLQAVPFLPKGSNGFYAADQLMYTWHVDDGTVKSASGKGRSTAILSGPDLFGASTITVDIATQDGSVSGEASVRVASIEPTVRLYDDHPLFGIQYWDAVGASEFVGDSEMTFAAVPYFAATRDPDDNALQYSWQVNGRSVAADTTHPSEITISAGQSGGIAVIALFLTHAKNLLLQADGKWSVTFTSAGTGAGAVVKDLFHGTQ